MARYRTGETRWVHAACVAGAYLVLIPGLFILPLGAGLSLPLSVAVSAPPLVYAALAVLLLREAPFVRRLSWVGSACVVHVLLGALAAVELAWAGGLALPMALAQVFVLFPPAPALTLFATPLTLAAFGFTASRAGRRPEASPRPAAAPARTKPVAPPVRAGKSSPETAAPAARPQTPLGISTQPVPAPAAARPPVPVAPVPPAPVVTPPTPPPAATPAASAVSPSKLARRGDDGMVRVSFARIAAQLPAQAFVLPFERLGESLREPHLVLVPRRVVLSQMRDGAVAITWAHIASQFPDLALGMSDDEFRKQYPDLKLWLPMDELASQLPPGSIPGAPAAKVPVENAPIAATPTTSSVAPAPAAATTVAPRAELVGPVALGRIVACFTGVGSFEAAAARVADTPVVTLMEPGLPRDAALAGAAPLLRSLSAASFEVVTLRTERVVVVLAVAPTPVVVGARLPGAPVALLALRAVNAAAAVGSGAPSLPAAARRALEPISVGGAVAGAAQALRSLGAVQPTVFADGPVRVHVFSAGRGDDKAVAALALNLADALGDGGDLGRPRVIVFRRGAEHTLVWPLAGGAGILVAAGPVTRPGRLLREAERAASVLEAR